MGRLRWPRRSSSRRSTRASARPAREEHGAGRDVSRPVPCARYMSTAAPTALRPPPRRVEFPERPRLAPGVKLAGQMQESAFVDPPWLLEREGAGYVQVTELLFRIAEACDGQRTLDEIAAVASDQTGRAVSADNVRQLVGTRLLAK